MSVHSPRLASPAQGWRRPHTAYTHTAYPHTACTHTARPEAQR